MAPHPRHHSFSWIKRYSQEYLSKIPARLYYMYKNDIDNLLAFFAGQV
ncbi:MAG: hypothetical protein MSD82_02555 [Prevotella sp.]|nr:hypothetical protein [Prevotella sp.]